MEKVAQLVTQKDVHGTQIRYPIKTGINFIGSAEDVDVLLQVPGVSAFHAFIGEQRPAAMYRVCKIFILRSTYETEVAEDGEEHFVEDLSSTNGTHIGPHDYQLGDWKLYQLVDGKQISFGPVQCTYEYIGVKAAGLGELETQQTQLLESTVSFPIGTLVAVLNDTETGTSIEYE